MVPKKTSKPETVAQVNFNSMAAEPDSTSKAGSPNSRTSVNGSGRSPAEYQAYLLDWIGPESTRR